MQNVEGHGTERIARVLDGAGRDVALDALDALVRGDLELGFADVQRLAGVVLHLRVVVAVQALGVRDLRHVGRGRGRGVRRHGGFLGGGGDGTHERSSSALRPRAER